MRTKQEVEDEIQSKKMEMERLENEEAELRGRVRAYRQIIADLEDELEEIEEESMRGFEDDGSEDDE